MDATLPVCATSCNDACGAAILRLLGFHRFFQKEWDHDDLFREGCREELRDVDAFRGDFGILGLAIDRVDAVFFHMLTLHAAGGATRRRRAFSIRFLGDDAVHAPRPWKTSPDFPGLADELAAGAEFDHPLFPLLWPPSSTTNGRGRTRTHRRT